jgi:hypothetical protein
VTWLVVAGLLVLAAGAILGVLLEHLVLEPRRRGRPPLHQHRLERLLDPDDDLSDLELAEIRAVEQRGREHMDEVRHAIYQARQAYTAKKRGG